MAGGISHAEQHGPVQLFRLLKSFIAPGVPVDGVVGMLDKIGTRFKKKAVGVNGPAVWPQVLRSGAVVFAAKFLHFVNLF